MVMEIKRDNIRTGTFCCICGTEKYCAWHAEGTEDVADEYVHRAGNVPNQG